jgi:ubiquinone/menaquinone biosynthesis C-methylase UbiE
MKTQTLLNYNQLADDYAQHRRLHPGVLQALLVGAALGADGRVLEVGCGSANYLASIAQVTGCAAWGIDPAAQMLAHARQQPGTLYLQLGSAERLDFADDFFDLLFSVDVIHHIGERAAYFAEAQRVLKPGGKLCTVTDSAEIIRQRRPLSVYFPDTVAVELRRYPAIETLQAEMQQAALRSTTLETVELAYPLHDLQIYRNKAFSCLHLIPEQAFQAGLAAMEQDLRGGAIECVARYVLVWGEKPADARRWTLDKRR